MEYIKEIFVKDYFEIHTYYSKKYGNKTIILMQVGSFHECYSYHSDTEKYGLDLVSLAQELDVCCTKKNGSLPLAKTNPHMMGFPVHVTSNFIDKLINMNYTVILIDQTTEPPNPKREVTGIYSPATHIMNKSSKNFYLVSLVFDIIKDIKSGSNQLCIGMTAYDLSTGEGYFYETYSKQSDLFIGLDDTLRFIETYPPREVILNNFSETFNNMNLNDILVYLNIKTDNIYYIDTNKYKKLSYQEQYLQSIYNIKSNINILEILELQFLNWARLSLVILLDYASSHQPILLSNLKIPLSYTNNKYLYLGNRAIQQLDVINNKENSLFNIINETRTVIGKRFLNDQLTKPIIDNKILTYRYNCIEKLIENNHMDNVYNLLNGICDLDRFNRKIEINMINPNEFYNLYNSYLMIQKLFNYFKEHNLLKTFDIDLVYLNNINELIKMIETRFIISELNNINFNNFTETDKSFYNKSIYNDIDDMQNNINISQNFMSLLIKELEKYVDDNIYFKKQTKTKKVAKKVSTDLISDTSSDDKPTNTLINLKFNERDGYYLLLTKRRCEVLKRNLENIKDIDINFIKININDLEFTDLPKSSNTKINCKKIKEISYNLIEYKNKMAKLLKTYFREDIVMINNKYNNLQNRFLEIIGKKIAFIDFINSGAISAIKYHYSKPIIKENDSSFFIAKEMRHPIVERISTETNYIPHDIMLGNNTEQNGILLYGINSSGKSTLMKSIGLNIIMAQIGYYVACSKFEYYPYHSLFTRICGNDNIFRGLSSFMVEMMELIAILKRNNTNSLIIADELAKGSEIRSASVIILYMLEKLIASQSSFITATHLHDLTKIDTIKKLDRLKIKHLKLTYDPLKDTIIYGRGLTDGMGETFYGLMMAKYLMKDKIFNDRTEEILKEYDDFYIKSSRYNKDVYLEECNICKSKERLETHHIVWQKNFDKNKINKNKFYLQRDNKSNLVVLCMKCHDKVDRNEIIINGFVETTDGKIFDYIINKKQIQKI